MPAPSTRPVLLLLVAGLLSACSSGGDIDPQAVLDAAAARLADAQTVHVSISGRDLPDSGSVLLSAEGDARRPDDFAGTLSLRTAGISADVDVLSTAGQVYARLPFTDELALVDPAALGFSDPATLFDADDGIGRLLAAATEVATTGSERLAGEVVNVITAQLPGALVGELLISADPDAPVEAVLSVTQEDDQIRQVVLTGPFYDVVALTSYTVVLTDWDAPVSIPSPPDGG